MNQDFSRKITVVVSIAAAVIVPIGVLVSGLLAGREGVWGALVGFGLACLYTYASIYMLKWVLARPVSSVAITLMSVTCGRLLVLAGVLFGLTYVQAIDTMSMLLCFLVLCIAYTVVEITYAYKAFGLMLKSSKD